MLSILKVLYEHKGSFDMKLERIVREYKNKNKYKNKDINVSNHQKYISRLLSEDLIEITSEGSSYNRYKITDKGIDFIEKMCGIKSKGDRKGGE